MRPAFGYALAAATLFLFSGAACAFAADPGNIPEPPSSPSPDDRPFVVVIDPGHGGADFGAVGRGGVKEKDVNLGVAKRAGELLQKTPGVKVLFTRTGDEFVPLEARTAFANMRKADAFVSIHANAASRKDATGVETFFLSLEATDDEARLTAVYENSGASVPQGRGADEDGVQEILLDLEMSGAHHLSAALAETIQSKVFAATGKEDRGVKQAPFLVLYGAAMPAVLVEIGFVSNGAEEKRLSSAREQARIAASITEGIIAFKKTAGVEARRAGVALGHEKN